jgi:hypothetical protein
VVVESGKDHLQNLLKVIDLYLESAEAAVKSGEVMKAEGDISKARDNVGHAQAAVEKISI